MPRRFLDPNDASENLARQQTFGWRGPQCASGHPLTVVCLNQHLKVPQCFSALIGPGADRRRVNMRGFATRTQHQHRGSDSLGTGWQDELGSRTEERCVNDWPSDINGRCRYVVPTNALEREWQEMGESERCCKKVVRWRVVERCRLAGDQTIPGWGRDARCVASMGADSRACAQDGCAIGALVEDE
jgi:hypothetical protein